MARIPAFRIPDRAEIEGISEDLFRYLAPLFIQVRDLSDALRGRLTFGTNINAEVENIEVRDGVRTAISLGRDPLGAVLITTNQGQVPTLLFERRDSSSAFVTLTFPTAVDGDVRATVLFLGAE